MFEEYPDVLDVAQTSMALRICQNSVYRLIREKQLGCRHVGRKILIPKICLIDYVSLARCPISQQ